MDDKAWQIGGLENMAEKLGLRSVTGITNSMGELQGRNMLPYSSIANSVIYSYSCLKMWGFMYSLKYLPVKRFSMTQKMFINIKCSLFVIYLKV